MLQKSVRQFCQILALLRVSCGFIDYFQPTKIFHNLVLEGGGIGELPIAARFRNWNNGVFERYSANRRHFGGSDSGFSAVGGYSATELTELVSEMKIQSFNDGHISFRGGTQRLIERFGWYRGDAFRKWIG